MTTEEHLQQEEIEILKSILEDSIVPLGTQNDQIEVTVEFQLTNPLRLRLETELHQISTNLQFLPPIIFSVHFHEDYPSSTEPPTFVLSSFYLTYSHLQQLCEKLDRIWKENLSTPIVYQWIECLKDELSRLDELFLSNRFPNHQCDDPRAMSTYDTSQAASIYEQLVQHNQEKENQKFQRDYHECPICLSTNIFGRDMIRLYKCRHTYCQSCLHDYTKLQIDNGSVEWLLCPDTQCNLSMLPSEIRAAIQDQSRYDKYERLLLHKTLENMEDVVWCPSLLKSTEDRERCSELDDLYFQEIQSTKPCQQPVLTGAAKDKLALCNECRFVFCKRCKTTYHSESLCTDEVDLDAYRQKQKKIRSRLEQLGLSNDNIHHLFKETLTAAKIETTTRFCPNSSCRVRIEKNEGCDHMYCVRCKTHFQWSEAEQPITEIKTFVERYESILQTAIENEDDESDKLPENYFKSTDNRSASVGEVLLKRSQKCPNVDCGKFNLKHGTGNYLICQYCRRGYCFVCGNEVVNQAKHFNKKCQRNS